ncbi:MAG: caspase family protein [Bacteroidaceae bacterium]|nr:caspase family protein [Bacteroidaceae bacterium]
MKKGLLFLLLTYLICMTAQAQVKQKELEKLFQDMLEYAKKGDADAQVLVGSYYYNGQGVGQDYAQAASWFRKAADQGIAEAQYNLGNCYKNGKGVKQDYAQAVAWHRKAAEQGFALAQTSLAIFYYNGQGVTKDYAQAVAWFRKAAEQGESNAKEFLPKAEKTLKEQQLSEEPEESEESEENLYQQYITAAKQGNAGAQYVIGYCYVKGDDVTKDATQAVSWFRKAADQGLAEAQNALGICYYGGEGVKQDYVQTASLFRKAADQGYAPAQRNLGYLYYNGEGVSQDYAQAVSWLRKAAEQEDEDAMEFLPEAEAVLKEFSKQQSLVTFDWLGFTPTVNKKEYLLNVGINSESRIEDVSVTVNGSLSRGINTVKSDGYDRTLNQKLTLNEGVNRIVVSVRNENDVTTSERTITCQTNNAAPVAEKKDKCIAFIIGNSDYKDPQASKLKNPVNDASDISAKLKQLGFEVILLLDATIDKLDKGMSDFKRKAENYDVALFYYSGHGIQSKGANYILPIDVSGLTAENVQRKCVDMQEVLNAMDDSQCKLKIVVLDACRDDPFTKSWHRSAGIARGLSIMSAPEGTIISYATAPGKTANDGTGRNSPYTEAFLKSLEKPNIDILHFFQDVGKYVKQKTNNEQAPWISFEFTGDFYFNKQ